MDAIIIVIKIHYKRWTLIKNGLIYIILVFFYEDFQEIIFMNLSSKKYIKWFIIYIIIDIYQLNKNNSKTVVLLHLFFKKLFNLKRIINNIKIYPVLYRSQLNSNKLIKPTTKDREKEKARKENGNRNREEEKKLPIIPRIPEFILRTGWKKNNLFPATRHDSKSIPRAYRVSKLV